MRNSDIQIELNIEVRGDLVIVTQPATTFLAIYMKPKGEPWIKAAGVPTGTDEFRARAWGAANGKARELGWIV
jgi:hypothetical protein